MSINYCADLFKSANGSYSGHDKDDSNFNQHIDIDDDDDDDQEDKNESNKSNSDGLIDDDSCYCHSHELGNNLIFEHKTKSRIYHFLFVKLFSF